MLKLKFSKRILSIEESGTVKFFSLLKKLKERGKNIINFSVGEPDFPTPQQIIEATKKALQEGKTKYEDVLGIKELRLALCEKLWKENRISCKPENLIVVSGAKEGLYMLMQVLCEKGDEILIPLPFWPSFKEQVRLAGAKPILVKTKEDYQLDLYGIEKAINQRTKAIIINTPNNPTGAVYNKKSLKKLIELAFEKEIFIIADEVYEKFIYDGLKHYSIASFDEELKRSITVNSFSKSYCMTGFRVGYVVASENIITQLAKLQTHLITNVCTFAQYGALEALKINKLAIKKMISEFEKRRNLSFKLAKDLFKCIKPRGTFYIFPNVTPYLKKIKTSEELAMFLLKNANIITVPGESFGMPSHLRISFACSREKIKEGFERIERVLG